MVLIFVAILYWFDTGDFEIVDDDETADEIEIIDDDDDDDDAVSYTHLTLPTKA